MAQPYNGIRRLVIAFDVGTTYSGVSYCILDPGVIPKIISVTKYPGQEHIAGSPKIPTLMYYDHEGNMVAAGAEAQLPEKQEEAEEEGWQRVEWFKLRLRPRTMPSKLRNAALPSLPGEKTVQDLFADFFRYLNGCAETFIKDSHLTVARSWEELRKSVTYVIAHPNGWEGPQQTKLRRAAIGAGLVPDTQEGRTRVVFVSEGEASLHYCIKGGFIDDSERAFVIADLGGGTLDFSAYKTTGTRPLRVDELDASKCELEGSVMVTQRAHMYLKQKLEESAFGTDDCLEKMSQVFDEGPKKLFRSRDDTVRIPFGSAKDRDPDHGIVAGKVKLPGTEVAKFFEPSIAMAVKAIQEHIQNSPIKVSAIYLVGGFSSSVYLKRELEERLRSANVAVNYPDGQVVKAVADGAVSFYIDHNVTARVAKVSYGAPCGIPYDANDPEHTKRRHLAYTRASGGLSIPGRFSLILEKGTVVSEQTEFRHTYFSEIVRGESPTVDVELTAYRGLGKAPIWVDTVEPSTLRPLCRVTADVSVIRSIAEETGSRGHRFQRCEYDVVLFFGGPELKAQICWKENGAERWGPGQIIYEDMSDVEDDDK